MLELQANKNKKLKTCASVLPDQDSNTNSDSDGDDDRFSLHDDSDLDISSDNESLHLQLGPVTQTIKQGYHVLVAFEKKEKYQYLVGVALEDEDSDGDIDVSFLRKSSKVDNKFTKPDVEDIGSVQKQKIHAILPPPKATGTTSRTKSEIVFEADFSKITLW